MNSQPTALQAGLTTWSARRLNKLARRLNATNYLEIGVNKGFTFKDIEIQRRVAVDPKFLFDIERYDSCSTEFHEKRSDEYFSSISNNEIFDLIFLDGLHTFEQTLRDFTNVIAHSHPHTVLLIDDTKPNDVFSTLREPLKTFQARKQVGLTSGAWHGDVYKIVYFIHDFMPSFNYRTMTGNGNPQTLVWRSNRDWRAPLFNNLETISRMTYFDMREHLALLNEAPEDDVIALCIDELLGIAPTCAP
jgi:hypothetical protein